MLFFTFKRMTFASEQGVALLMDRNHFASFPVHTLAIAIIMQSIPCAQLLGHLPVVQGQITVKNNNRKSTSSSQTQKRTACCCAPSTSFDTQRDAARSHSLCRRAGWGCRGRRHAVCGQSAIVLSATAFMRSRQIGFAACH